MPHLRLTLFGVPTVQVDEKDVHIRRRKEAAVLYYLACAGGPVARDQLFDLLSDYNEDNDPTAARQYLYVIIHRLARLLPACLAVKRDTLDFAPACTVWVDVAQFRTTIARFQPGADPAPLQAAVNLYRGAFLEGFSVRGAPAFAEWLLLERENVHQLFVQALLMLLAGYERLQDTARGITAAQQLLALEPWNESAHQQLILLLARDGQYRAALAQYELCCQVLADELGAEPLPETVALYERLKTTEAPPPHNLPPAATPFIGREAELVQVQETLINPLCRLLTLLGLGGVGKTHLALEAARQLVAPASQRVEQPFPDGVYYVSLIGVEGTTLTNPEAVAETINRVSIAIGQALDLTFTGHLAPRTQLRAALHDRQLLLLLDNYEHVIDTADLLLDVLHHAPGVTVLVTSRERLNLDEEWMLPVQGLPLPTTPAEVPTAAASRLFLQEARRVQITWTYSAAEALPITRLCRLVDGLPLALKLAAATLRYTTCAALLNELEATFAGLETRLHNVPERHRSMRAVMAYSWELLRPDEQALLRRVAVFHGGFDRVAAQAVTQLGPGHLADLVDKSLISLDDSGRYTLHELVRQFAAEQLAIAAAEVAQAATRHAHYYARFVEQQPLNLLSELDNIRAAWRWAISHHAWETMAQMQPQLSVFYERAGLLQEGAAVFGQAVTHVSEAANADDAQWVAFHISYARFLGLRSHYAQALSLLTTLEAYLPRLADRALSAYYHEQRGWLLANQSAYTDAIERIERAQALYQEAEDALGVARNTYYRGVIARHQGDHQQAITQLAAAQRQLVALGAVHEQHNHVLIDVYTELSVVHSRQGRPEAARSDCLEALYLSQRSRDRFREAIALNRLGKLAQEQRDLVQARDYYQQALTLRWQMGDRSGEASCRFNLAGVDHDLGHYSQARDEMQAALTIFEEVGDMWEVVNVWNAIGIFYQELGDLAQAEVHLQQGLQLARSINDESGETFLLANLGLVLADKGETTIAVDTLHHGLELAQRQGDADLIATFESYLGLAWVHTDQPARATDHATRALELRAQLGQHPLQVDDRATLALAALLQGDHEQATTLATQNYALLIDYDYIGPELPQRACFVCYQVFAAVGDNERAQATLQAAVRLVEQRAVQIHDPDLRQSYCEQVPINREILTTAGLLPTSSETIVTTGRQRNGANAHRHDA